jgi:Putative transposase/Transposase zinc-binding domain
VRVRGFLTGCRQIAIDKDRVRWIEAERLQRAQIYFAAAGDPNLYKYLGCGDLRKGFARIKCKECQHEVLLAFSCKGRYFCPSCHQKRVLMFGEWITEDILYPLPHRQYVFTIPKMLRPYFRFDRKLLGKLSQCAYQSLKEFFQTTLNRKEAIPGVVVSIQTFGDLINFHPHLHCLVTDGCFMANDWFYVLPEIDVKKLESLFRHKVLKLLRSEKRISKELVEKLLSWKNSGFSVHNQVKIKSRDRGGQESLAQYILRSPFSLEKMTYQQQTKTVLYRSKMNPVLKKNFAVFPVLDWIATLTTHIPNKGEQLIRYYGYYSNVSRGKRKKEKPKDRNRDWRDRCPAGIQGIKKALVLLHSKSL